jgi:uncharacterized protein (TIGR02466 family)
MTETVVASMFETPLLVDTLPDFAAVNAELAAAIRSRRDQDPAGITRSNRQGWHSDLGIFQWGGAAIKTLGERIIANANANSVDIRQPAMARYRWLNHGWANILRRGASNQFHIHPGAFWSAVYFVDDGYGGSADSSLGGEIEIEDPRMPMVIMEEPDLRFRPRPDWQVPQHEIFLRPATGMLLMFPGWLRHGVRTYQGDNERISIAINLMVSPVAA